MNRGFQLSVETKNQSNSGQSDVNRAVSQLQFKDSLINGKWRDCFKPIMERGKTKPKKMEFALVLARNYFQHPIENRALVLFA